MLTARSEKAARLAVIEPLEDRQLMSVSFGTNLILNPGAENYDGSANGFEIVTPYHWSANADATVVQYDSGYGFAAGVRKPANAGDAFFAGGPDVERTDFFQSIDLSSIFNVIHAGQVNFSLAAAIGGRSSDRDNAVVSVNFRDASQTLISQVSTADVSRGDRDNRSKFIRRTRSGVVPADAQFAQIQIHFKRDDGSYNDGYADNLSLVLATNTASTLGVTPTIAKSTIPSTAMTGQKVSGKVVVNLANTSTSVNKGLDTVSLYASSNGVVDSTSVAIASTHRTLSLIAGKATRLTLPIKALLLPVGTYTIFAQTTDSLGTVVTAATGPSVQVAAPFVSLSANLTAVSPQNIAAGKTFNLTLVLRNTGNIDAVGLASVAVGLSSDGLTPSVALSSFSRRLTVKAGGSRATVWRVKVRVPANQTAGVFKLIAAVAQGTIAATAVSFSPVTITA